MGVAVLHRNVDQASVVDARPESLLFFSTKKKTTPAMEEKGRVIPIAGAPWVCSSIASPSGGRGSTAPLGDAIPGRRYMAQSYGC